MLLHTIRYAARYFPREAESKIGMGTWATCHSDKSLVPGEGRCQWTRDRENGDIHYHLDKQPYPLAAIANSSTSLPIQLVT